MCKILTVDFKPTATILAKQSAEEAELIRLEARQEVLLHWIKEMGVRDVFVGMSKDLQDTRIKYDTIMSERMYGSKEDKHIDNDFNIMNFIKFED